MDKGIIQITSENNFEATYSKLKSTLDNNPLITIIAELDHCKNARKVDLSLGKSRIILFGNPRLGTPLMQSNIAVGIDLPQKILVFEQQENVIIAYNDPMYLKKRHNIEGKDQLLEKMSGALKSLSEIASK